MAIVQNTSETIHIKDVEEHYQFINESGAELFGHTPEEIIGKHDEDLFDPESAAECSESTYTAAAEPIPWR